MLLNNQPMRSTDLINAELNMENNENKDSVIRNDSARIIQPEILIRTDSLGQTNGGNTIDRKGSLAIGQSVFYTDYPPKDYPSGKLILFQSKHL